MWKLSWRSLKKISVLRILKYLIQLYLFPSNIYWLKMLQKQDMCRLIVIAVEVVIPNCLNTRQSVHVPGTASLCPRSTGRCRSLTARYSWWFRWGNVETYNTSADSWMFYNRMLTTWSLEAFYPNHPKWQIHFVVRKKDYSDKFSFNLNLIYLSSEIKWELMIAL